MEIEKLKTQRAGKEKDLVPVLQDNKCLTEILMKTKKEIDKIEKQMKNKISKKVTVMYLFVCVSLNSL